MQRRRASLQFMGGLWVFPGGAVDAADSSAAALGRIPATDAGRCRALHAYESGAELPGGRALALRVAACRETFEEAGLLLARDAGGAHCAPDRLARLVEQRATVLHRAESFAELLEAENLYLEIGALVYWSHWITPSIEPRRYDTRFFAIATPPGQTVCEDDGESSERGWFRPSDALEAYSRGEMLFAPPTQATLEELADRYAARGTVAALLAGEADRPTPPVLPKLVPEAGAVRAVLPWDEAYAALPGDAVAEATRYPPEYTKRPSSYLIQMPGRVLPSASR